LFKWQAYWIKCDAPICVEGQNAEEKVAETLETEEDKSQSSRKKRHIQSGPSFFNRFLFDNRPVFDGLFFGGNSIFTRKPRQIRRPLRPLRDPRGPVYPPVDPFGNTEYIPLPGPSNPAYALPISGGNPHFSRVKQHFVRPIRQSKYFSKSKPISNFLYDSSLSFYNNKKEVLRQIQNVP